MGDLKKHKTRIVKPIQLIEVSKEESIDIDDFSDWAIASYFASRRTIIIRADASKSLGLGHIYRAIALVQELAEHRIAIATDITLGSLAIDVLSEFPFEIIHVEGNSDFITCINSRKPDLVILDQLDTDTNYVKAIQRSSKKVITFEDQGEGAKEADLLVSDLYANLSISAEQQLTGICTLYPGTKL